MFYLKPSDFHNQLKTNREIFRNMFLKQHLKDFKNIVILLKTFVVTIPIL